MTAHLEWETLSDLAESRGDPAPDARPGLATSGHATRHLAACADCRDRLSALRALALAAHELPLEVEPPPDLWREVAASIAAGRSAPAPSAVPNAPAQRRAPFPAPAASRERRARVIARSPRGLAAAALVLMALSSAATAFFLRRGDSLPRLAAGGAASAGIANVLPALPAAYSATEEAYLANVAELHAVFVAQRAALAPATIAVVESALAAIDAAIAEARAALLADPANQALAELLSISYRQKVELLRRAAEVPHSL